MARKREWKDKRAQALYLAYPRHVACGAAEKAIVRALKEEDFDVLLEAVEKFASSVAGVLGTPDACYIPHPATWFNQRRWEDEETTRPHNPILDATCDP